MDIVKDDSNKNEIRISHSIDVDDMGMMTITWERPVSKEYPLVVLIRTQVKKAKEAEEQSNKKVYIIIPDSTGEQTNSDVFIYDAAVSRRHTEYLSDKKYHYAVYPGKIIKSKVSSGNGVGSAQLHIATCPVPGSDSCFLLKHEELNVLDIDTPVCFIYYRRYWWPFRLLKKKAYVMIDNLPRHFYLRRIEYTINPSKEKKVYEIKLRDSGNLFTVWLDSHEKLEIPQNQMENKVVDWFEWKKWMRKNGK